MKHKSILLKNNKPNIISELEKIGFTHSDLCNEGIYILVENGIIMQVNHLPYKEYIDFGSNETDFINYAKSVFLS